MYTKNNGDLTQSLSEALSWSLLKKSVSGEDLTKLETSTTSGVSSALSSGDSNDLKFLSNIQISKNKHVNTCLVTPN
jgi:hypothetical protein